MSIDVTNETLKILKYNLTGTPVNDGIDGGDGEGDEPTVLAPDAKPTTTSISEILNNMLSCTGSGGDGCLTPGSYTVPNGHVIIYVADDGTIGFQFVGDDGLTLDGFKDLTIKGLVENVPTSNASGVNGEIDEYVKQGGTGDCWIVAAVLSLTATEEGKALIKSSLEIQDNGDVIVNFKGLGYKITVTAAEIKAQDTDKNLYDDFSNGDNDMLVFEIAVQKLLEQHPDLRELFGMENVRGNDPDGYIGQGGFAEYLIEWLSGNKSTTTSSLDNQFTAEGIEEWVTVPSTIKAYAGQQFPRPATISYEQMFNSAQTNFSRTYIDWYNDTYSNIARNQLIDGLSEEEVLKQLKDAYKNQPCSMTFSMYVYTGETVHKAKCTDGSTFVWQCGGDGSFGGHAFAVVGITEDTITFVNPWDSTQQVTMTWEEFAKLGIGRISYTPLDGVTNDDTDPDVPTENLSDEQIEQITSEMTEYIESKVNSLNLSEEQKSELKSNLVTLIENFNSNTENRSMEYDDYKSMLQSVIDTNIVLYVKNHAQDEEDDTLTAEKKAEIAETALSKAEEKISAMDVSYVTKLLYIKKVKKAVEDFVNKYSDNYTSVNDFTEKLNVIIATTILIAQKSNSTIPAITQNN